MITLRAKDNTEYVIELSVSDPILEKIGGKALNLAKMTSAGFDIPPAFTVSVDAYDTFIKKELEAKVSKILNSIDFKDDKSISKGCAQIRDIIKRDKLPEKLQVELKNQIENLPEGYYAVR